MATSTLTDVKYKQGVKLTEEQVSCAMEDLNKKDFVTRFPRVDKFYADPEISRQVYCLHSFVPAKGASPDANGVYGMVKCRGTFASLNECDDRAEHLIRNVDSFHSIYHGYVGRPFPLSRNPDFVKEVREIDLKKQTTNIISEDVKEIKSKEKKQVEEIKEREKKLKEDVSSDDPYEKYTTLRVKKAQITWTYIETKKKVDEMKLIILNTRKEIDDMDTENTDYKTQYLERYNTARKESGLTNEEGFLKYLENETDDLDF
jgi:hypothetical protein